ncbi:hypothetical protein BKA82DRAFT_327813 [Pisolithus tinctorius]|uniref:Uncharacterized protein n=1 Tax=Pisolithus tinctorius Marx 270 TaxID=870435 RepID=A0A0C3JID5_PISTI|nr:hypothetical protein BKA82DRAFT_327813 [Pisolithus tinctorius]KIO08828.1 hypothetical protein M404DRAFT_327813 [Pisolithus tinctorius Marx 270]
MCITKCAVFAYYGSYQTLYTETKSAHREHLYVAHWSFLPVWAGRYPVASQLRISECTLSLYKYLGVCWRGRQPSTVQTIISDGDTSLRPGTGESFNATTEQNWIRYFGNTIRYLSYDSLSEQG